MAKRRRRREDADDPQGQSIYHEPRMRDFEFAPGDPERIDKITDHVARCIGAPDFVFHEIVSDLVHVDVHVVQPTPQRPYYTLFTSGMSDRPMTVPEDWSESPFAEVLLCLPQDWQLSDEAFADESWYWPIRWLKILARLPHEYETWLWDGHTVPNGDPPEPFAPNTEMCCMALAPPLLCGEEIRVLEVDAQTQIHFFAAVPLYREEMLYKLRHGMEKLSKRLARHEVTELLDPERPNCCVR